MTPFKCAFEMPFALGRDSLDTRVVARLAKMPQTSRVQALGCAPEQRIALRYLSAPSA